MMSCISWHCSSGDVHPFSFCMMYSFSTMFYIYFQAICHFHWHTMHIMWLQILTSAMNQAQVGKWYSPSHAKDRTNTTLFVVYWTLFSKLWLPVSSLHYLDASFKLPGNIPVHCRLCRVPCVMRPAVQHSLPQAVGFRCTHCTSEFGTRHAMDCHCHKQSSLGTGCADPSNIASPFLSLDVPVIHRQSFRNMSF